MRRRKKRKIVTKKRKIMQERISAPRVFVREFIYYYYTVCSSFVFI